MKSFLCPSFFQCCIGYQVLTVTQISRFWVGQSQIISENFVSRSVEDPVLTGDYKFGFGCSAELSTCITSA